MKLTENTRKSLYIVVTFISLNLYSILLKSAEPRTPQPEVQSFKKLLSKTDQPGFYLWDIIINNNQNTERKILEQAFAENFKHLKKETSWPNTDTIVTGSAIAGGVSAFDQYTGGEFRYALGDMIRSNLTPEATKPGALVLAGYYTSRYLTRREYQNYLKQNKLNQDNSASILNHFTATKKFSEIATRFYNLTATLEKIKTIVEQKIYENPLFKETKSETWLSDARKRRRSLRHAIEQLQTIHSLRDFIEPFHKVAFTPFGFSEANSIPFTCLIQAAIENNLDPSYLQKTCKFYLSGIGSDFPLREFLTFRYQFIIFKWLTNAQLISVKNFIEKINQA